MDAAEKRLEKEADGEPKPAPVGGEAERKTHCSITSLRPLRRDELPTSLVWDAELRSLCRRAKEQAGEDWRRLADAAESAYEETRALRRRLRKQEFDWSTLFEMIGQTSARALDVEAMQTYVLRMVSGHFATPLVLIARRTREQKEILAVTAAQGLRQTMPAIPLDSVLCREAMTRRLCLSLNDFSDNAPEAAALRAAGGNLVVPLIQEVERSEAVLEGFLVLGKSLTGRIYGREDFEFLHVLGKMTAICLRNEALYRRAIVDDLTGVASRGHFDVHLTQELNRIRVYGHRGLGLLLLDVDHFKQFNDRWGHQLGDLILRELAQTLAKQVRNVDLVARYGGEEFVVVLLEIGREKALEVAERLRKAIESLRLVADDGTPLQVTASFGAACYPEDAEDKVGLIHAADQAMYRAKDFGRNCVVEAERLGCEERDAAEGEVERRGTTAKVETGEER